MALDALEGAVILYLSEQSEMSCLKFTSNLDITNIFDWMFQLVLNSRTSSISFKQIIQRFLNELVSFTHGLSVFQDFYLYFQYLLLKFQYLFLFPGSKLFSS